MFSETSKQIHPMKPKKKKILNLVIEMHNNKILTVHLAKNKSDAEEIFKTCAEENEMKTNSDEVKNGYLNELGEYNVEIYSLTI